MYYLSVELNTFPLIVSKNLTFHSQIKWLNDQTLRPSIKYIKNKENKNKTNKQKNNKTNLKTNSKFNDQVHGLSMFSFAKVCFMYGDMLPGSSLIIIWILKLPFLQNYNIFWLWIIRVCPPLLLKIIK